MKTSRIAQIGCLAAWALTAYPVTKAVPFREPGLPAGATRCAPAIPLSIDLIPLDTPAVGRPLRFRVDVDSDFDPDLVRAMEIVYEFPPRVRQAPGWRAAGQAVRISGRTQLELAVLLPDEERYRIRARVIAHLADGRDVSQTAVHWAGVSKEDKPEAMIGRIIDPGGVGIRVYLGETVKEPQ